MKADWGTPVDFYPMMFVGKGTAHVIGYHDLPDGAYALDDERIQAILEREGMRDRINGAYGARK